MFTKVSESNVKAHDAHPASPSTNRWAIIIRGVLKVSFPSRPTAIKPFIVWSDCVYVIMSYDACTSGTSRVLLVASLERLKMEAFILAPADYEVRYVIKFLNAQSIAPIEIRHTGLVLGEFRVQIPLLTKLIGILYVLSLSHQRKCCVGFTLPRSINHYS